ncbi:MAG: DNA repair protein RadC [Dysgonamonadaceae bacterium]|jgi:DNA repair protein RadC|nr:DNA repair protein RadC [Dysgonamonadaceae bacterium]
MKQKLIIQKLPIREWAVADRPREKYLDKGFQALSDSELLAILLRSGTPDLSAVDLAKLLLKQCDHSLNKLSNYTFNDLIAIHGIGEAKALSILTTFELAKRCRAEKVVQQKRIITANDILELMQPKIADLPHEEFWVIFLNQASNLLGVERLAQGGISYTSIDPRLILKKAITYTATGIILCHNHPSGLLKPSDEDIILTEKIDEMCKLFHISLIEHLIIRKNKYYSFYRAGLTGK